MTEGQRFVCVSGMHRSGTSLVTRVVNLLGVDLGDADDLLDGPDNPRGFWESLSLTKFGEKVLQSMGGSWDDPPVLPDGWESSPRLDQARPAASALLGRILGPAPVVGWKDPRIAVLLPFWRTVVSAPRTLLVVRDPREVAGSLARRNGFPPERSAYLWLRYNVAGWRGDDQRALVCYEDVVNEPQTAADRLAHLLGLPRPDQRVRARVAEAVDPQLRHRDPVGDGPVMRLAVELHRLLQAGDAAAVDEASAELQRRWLRAAAVDGAVRRARRMVRPVVPRPLRRRLRSRVGALTSWPARQASLVGGGAASGGEPGYTRHHRPSDSCA